MKTDDPKKTRLWCFRITEKDAEIIQDLVDKYSINVSSFIRNTIKKKHQELEEGHDESKHR